MHSLNSAVHTRLMARLRMSQKSCFQILVTGITSAVEIDEASSICGATEHPVIWNVFDSLLKETCSSVKL